MAKRPSTPPKGGGRARGGQQRPTKESFIGRALDALKTLKGIVWGIAGVIGAVTAWYAATYLVIERERKARFDRVDQFLSALKHDTTSANREIALDSLELAHLADHLEAHVIDGLIQMVRRERPVTPQCNLAESGGPGGLPSDLGHALRIVWNLQQQQARPHPFVDRMVDRLLEKFEPTLVEPARSISLANTDLRGADLAGIRLQAASFHGACLTAARLDSAFLDSADFSGATLRSASLTSARGRRTRFVRAVLVDADLSNASFSNANFRGANLSCATLGNASLDSAYFSDAVAPWAFFGGAKLRGAEKWNEVRDLRGGFFPSVTGLDDSLLVWTHSHGAADDTTDQANWTGRKATQLKPGGLCAPA